MDLYVREVFTEGFWVGGCRVERGGTTSTEVINHHDPLNNPLIKPYVLGGMASGGWEETCFLGRLGMVKALHMQTFPEKVFGAPKTEPKHPLGRYLDVL